MKLLKTQPFFKNTAAAILFATASLTAFAQEASEKPVAFRVGSGEYVSMVSGGGLRTTGKTITARHIFQIVDANGGELADGDSVKIKEVNMGAAKPTFWQERSDGTIGRIGKADDACVFKVKKGEKTIQLLAASGKFVTVTDKALTTTDSQDKATPFELVENPTPAATATPAASASSSSSPKL